MLLQLKKNIIVLSTAVFGYFSLHAQQEWHLRKEQSGIKIYMRSNEHSSFNEIRVEMNIRAKMSSFAALLLDVPNDARWVYNVKSAQILKRIAENELYYYEVVNLPFPVSDRDLVVHLKMTQDSISKTLTVSAVNMPNYVPQNKNKVRVAMSNETWHVIQIGSNLLHIDYFLEIDPGGSIPAWLTNSLAEKGPYESFRHLQEQVDRYKNVKVPFIRD